MEWLNVLFFFSKREKKVDDNNQHMIDERTEDMRRTKKILIDLSKDPMWIFLKNDHTVPQQLTDRIFKRIGGSKREGESERAREKTTQER